jgi:hypothetical protein
LDEKDNQQRLQGIAASRDKALDATAAKKQIFFLFITPSAGKI